MPTRTDDRHDSERHADGKERRKHKVKVLKTKSGDSIRRSSRDRGRDREKGRERDPTRSEQSLSERGSAAGSTSTTSQRRVSAPVPSLHRQDSLGKSMDGGSRVSLPYPAFSKAHSREAVGSKETLGSAKQNRSSSDLVEDKKKGSKRADKEASTGRGPPSPPLTADGDGVSSLEEKRRKLEQHGEELRQQFDEVKKNGNSTTRKPSSSRMSSNGSLRDSKTVKKAQTSPRRTASHNNVRSKGYRYRPNTLEDEDSSLMSHSRSSSPSSRQTDSVTKPTVASSVDSGATQRAPKQVYTQNPISPDADDEASPARTPTPRGMPFAPNRQQTPGSGIYSTQSSHPQPQVPGQSSAPAPAPPPPPPPPPMMQVQPPRVDYLMQHGGLVQKVPKHYLDVIDPTADSQFNTGDLPDSSRMAQQVQRFFTPFANLLDDYAKVMNKNGSVAVATGYRSIARRLLDRLEAVFARDISSEICHCAMCEHHFPPDQDEHDTTGISWGEILEFVSGRRELPQWPPFDITDAPDPDTVGLGILETPMQKLDIDVPDEYRDHYIKQSKKTKSSVDRWLAGQATANAAPDEADDDTLTFAMLTRLDEIQRPYFKKLLGVSDTRPPSVQPATPRAKTPLNAPKSELMTRTGLALQRLYRLANPPRAPECACYLVCNPHMHNILATLAAVSDHEWDILTSGRFDGFLWSGAEDQAPSAPPSRGPTPALNGRISRGPTPGMGSTTSLASGAGTGPGGAPVALDEETEIAVLAEVERDIYLGMEVLEDAFEALHQRAEAVRANMRARGAGLAMAQAARRGASGDTIEARLGTPASQSGIPTYGQWDGNGDGYDAETNDDGISMFGADWKSELAPDDSASNISGVRKFRRKKRNEERRTPAPIEEEDEEIYDRRKSRDKHGRRR